VGHPPLKKAQWEAREAFVVKLKDKKGKSFQQIANYYGIQKSMAHKIYHRAKRKAAQPTMKAMGRLLFERWDPWGEAPHSPRFYALNDSANLSDFHFAVVYAPTKEIDDRR
jgi:hypothetical protein